MKKQIAIIFGGKSSEHEVSINSAKNILKALDTKTYEASLLGISKQGTWYSFDIDAFEKISAIDDRKMNEDDIVTLVSKNSKTYVYHFKKNNFIQIDCAFPIVHGTQGEDGVLQGHLQSLGLPYVGCGVMSSAINMDKEVMKIILTSAGIANSKFVVLKNGDSINYQKIVDKIGTPFFIKPANAGSSVGVHKIKSENDLSEKLKDSFKYDHKVIAEEFIDGKEIECSVMGLNNSPLAATPGELVVKHEFYSYEAKYLDPQGAEIIIPARLTQEQTETLRQLAVRAYKAMYCDGMARIDFFLDKSGKFLINELNTLPGFTKISMYPMMWKAHGVEYTDLINRLIQTAFEKQKQDEKLDLNFIK